MIAAALRAGPRALVAFAAERPGAAIAGFVLGLVALAALLAPLIATHDPFDLASFDVLDATLPPAWLEGSDPRFLLGTDAQGRDLLSAILYGTRISLTVGVLAVLIQAVIGVPLGLLAGYTGGRTDTLVSRAADIQLSLSTLMLAIIALALFRAGLGGESLSRYAVPLLVVVIGLGPFCRIERRGLPLLVGLLQDDLDRLFDLRELLFAEARQVHSLLEEGELLFEAAVLTLELSHDGFQAAERLLEALLLANAQCHFFSPSSSVRKSGPGSKIRPPPRTSAESSPEERRTRIFAPSSTSAAESSGRFAPSRYATA